MFPPSVHPEGETVDWHKDGDLAPVEATALLRDAGILAVASLLMQHWPAPEARTRYYAWGAMIGALLRCGVALETVERVVQVFVDRFPPGRAKKSRLRAPAVLRARLDRGAGRVPGFGALKEVFGAVVTDLCREWLPRRLAGTEGARFQIVDDALSYKKWNRDGTVDDVRLANFSARIIEEQIVDDGASRTRRYCIAGQLSDGTPLPEALVDATAVSGDCRYRRVSQSHDHQRAGGGRSGPYSAEAGGRRSRLRHCHLRPHPRDQ
jgi:hypothetical protein